VLDATGLIEAVGSLLADYGFELISLLVGSGIALLGIWQGSGISRLRERFRLAILEQVENCQRMLPDDPRLGEDRAMQLSGWTPSFDRLRDLLGSTNLRQDVGANLAWSITRADELSRQFQEVVARIGSEDPPRAGELRGSWITLLERLQVVGCLLLAESRRRRLTMIGIPASFDERRHLFNALTRPERARFFAHIDDDRLRGAPHPPKGEEYADCTPEARDAAGAARLEREKAWLGRRF
jgi:hypothetical protein